METKQSSSHSPPSWRHTLIRVVYVCFIFAMGLQPLANILQSAFSFTTTTNNRLTNLEHQLYAPPAEYIQPITAQETNTLTSTTGSTVESSSSQAVVETAFDPTTTTTGKPGNENKEQHSYNSSTSSSNSSTFLPVVVQATGITSIPPHVINHHVVNMNGRKQLGQGEKILVVGLPKSGTSSITQFYRESKQFRSCHFACAIPVDANGYGTYNNRTTGRYMGVCMAEAKQKKLPLIKTCGDYQMIGQMDFPTSKVCYLPQITMLNELHEEHPDATFILNLRNADRWSDSVNRWKGLGTRLSYCEMGPINAKGISLRKWYHEHTLRIRQFVTDHPSHALVEIDIESSDTGKRMANLFGLDEKFWVSEKCMHAIPCMIGLCVCLCVFFWVTWSVVC